MLREKIASVTSVLAQRFCECEIYHTLSILCSTMAVGLKGWCLFLFLLDVIVFIHVCSVLSDSQDTYNDALRNERGKLYIV